MGLKGNTNCSNFGLSAVALELLPTNTVKINPCFRYEGYTKEKRVLVIFNHILEELWTRPFVDVVDDTQGKKTPVLGLLRTSLCKLVGVLSRTKVPEHHFCAVKLLGWQQQRGERREIL